MSTTGNLDSYDLGTLTYITQGGRDRWRMRLGKGMYARNVVQSSSLPAAVRARSTAADSQWR